MNTTTQQPFEIGRDNKSGWTVTNTESGIIIGTFWFRQEAEHCIEDVQARIVAKQQRDRALYGYGN